MSQILSETKVTLEKEHASLYEKLALAELNCVN